MTAEIEDPRIDPSEDPPTDSHTLDLHQLSREDHGRLPDDTRRAVVALLRGPYLHQERNAAAWRAIIRDEAAVRELLGNLFLRLSLDTERGLAFIENAPLEEAPKVVRRVPLTLIDTAVVLLLRLRLLRDAGATGRVFIGRDEIDDELAPYRPATNTDASTFAKRINASVEKMKKASVLLSTAEDTRFEISPILTLVFDVEQVAAVTAEIEALVATSNTASRAAPDEDEPDDFDPRDEPAPIPRRSASEDGGDRP
ncbi:DUF4194 domain-containing protein [Granulicoccus phenolivorans]|uniref:DUF4194 domain-containing protein n=1 Tax=Granulicoccus phenolivorans TaxID=266854 RepID=UPI00138B18C2|nr:DUF4194 domain-containing protein [Granulicoccus phenolivorans]